MSQPKDNQQPRLTMSRRKTQEEFVEEVNRVHNGNVEVLGLYEMIETPIKIRYRDCGHEEMKKPVKLLIGQGCGQCRFKRLSKTKQRTKEQFVDDLHKKGIYYIEVLSDFNGVRDKITVRNSQCGHIYDANAGNILMGSGCPKCHGMKSHDEFVSIIEEKYPMKYDILGTYKNNRTKILVRHKPCGYEWTTSPKDLLNAERCPRCMKSRGELYIEEYLKREGIEYKTQYTFDDCKDRNKLMFDFMVVINGHMKLIEFDGFQHFDKRAMYYSEKQVEHDKQKDIYCETNNIPLLRIPYTALKSSKIDKLLDSYCK